MPTLFTRIIEGELPGTFIWRDPECVGFLSINPLRAGHALVVPRAEVDHWVDLSGELAAHLMLVAQAVARAQIEVYRPLRVGLMIAGLEVPHTHLHVIPIDSESDLHFDRARPATPDALTREAERLRAALRAHGAQGASD